MIIILSGLLAIIIASFSLVLLFGAPYLPTLKQQIKTGMELANLKPGQTLLELGSGDGRVLIAAAKAGYRVIGYELNPLLYLLSVIRLWPYRSHAKVIFGNFWNQKWPQADAIYTFLLPRLMDKLETKIISEQAQGCKVISFAFKFTNIEPEAEKDGVFLYKIKL